MWLYSWCYGGWWCDGGTDDYTGNDNDVGDGVMVVMAMLMKLAMIEQLVNVKPAHTVCAKSSGRKGNLPLLYTSAAATVHPERERERFSLSSGGWRCLVTLGQRSDVSQDKCLSQTRFISKHERRQSLCLLMVHVIFLLVTVRLWRCRPVLNSSISRYCGIHL